MLNGTSHARPVKVDAVCLDPDARAAAVAYFWAEWEKSPARDHAVDRFLAAHEDHASSRP